MEDEINLPQTHVLETPADHQRIADADSTALRGAPGRQTHSVGDNEAQRPAQNLTEQLGIVPDDAERFPVEEANDHIVWAFFRSGQYWRNAAEFVAKEPRSYNVVEPNGSLLIVAGPGDSSLRSMGNGTVLLHAVRPRSNTRRPTKTSA